MLFRESIFLTGFPGFIAGRLVERLTSSETQFFLLVEPRFVNKAMEEIELISEEQGVPLEAFSLVEGDITKPNLGMSKEDLEVVRFETTQMFHLAAVYDLGVDRDLAFSVNLEGTRNVNELAKNIKNLRRYNY